MKAISHQTGNEDCGVNETNNISTYLEQSMVVFNSGVGVEIHFKLNSYLCTVLSGLDLKLQPGTWDWFEIMDGQKFEIYYLAQSNVQQQFWAKPWKVLFYHVSMNKTKFLVSGCPPEI